MKHYVSEASQFIDQLKAERPYLAQEQRKGRLLLWEKTPDAQLRQGFEAARVPQKPYVYQSDA